MPDKTDKIIIAESVSEEPKQHFAIPARDSNNMTQAQEILRGRQAQPREM